MTFIKKSAVKTHLSTRNRNGIHLYRPASQPDATGYSGEPSVRAESNAIEVIEDNFSEPRSSGVEPPQNKAQTDSGQAETLAKSKRAHA